MDILLDTSWNLHYISTNSASYRNLLSAKTTQDHLSRYFDRLSSFLAQQKPQYVDDLNDENEKLGPLRECKYQKSRLQIQPPPNITSAHRTNTTALIQIQLLYQHTTFTIILYSPHLILTKASASHTKHVTTFLSDTFSISINPLKLPSNFLTTSLQTYITTLLSTTANPPAESDDEDEPDHLVPEKRAAILRTAIGTLKITISFSGTVAPHLRTLDIGVPYETVDALTLQLSGKSNDSQNVSFAQRLAEHIHLQTGLKLPLASTNSEDDAGDETSTLNDEGAGSVGSQSSGEVPLRLSKLACAAFAISADGRLRFTAKAIGNVGDPDNIVIVANKSIIGGVVEVAKKRADVGAG